MIITPMMTLELAGEPAFEIAGELAVIAKSTKLKVAVAWCVSEPLVPFNVRLSSPAAVALQETVALPDSLTSGGMTRLHVSP